MKLYWVFSKTKTEDWFVIAKSKQKAERFFENAEGFDTYEGQAELICLIPKKIIVKFEVEEEKFPNLEILKELGGVIYSEDVPRIINFNGKVYVEGHLTYKTAYEEIENKTGVYIIRFQNTDNYKIGITKNLKTRISQFSTGNPDNIIIEYFIATEHYKSLEKHFHSIFKNNRMKGEWFKFTQKEFQELESNLVILAESDLFFVYDIKGLYEWLHK